ncbi:PdaC/SigV domain-containing protein [Paenibacillus mendelii]|uniref:PdaC/SigV domain-containing protein n=1 Tax=Paenibacillus mendelii TaxID=206163 RepID=A0ABV6J8D4_9BACL|nr:DUF4163 domain-containing protein [Paenibacillus mendelii]MCQ6561305.1 DUF4163 domain-containing protein [Paenibacillus mendelii]
MNTGMKWSTALLAASVLLGGTSITAGTSAYAASAAAAPTAGKQGVQEPAVVLKYNGKTLSQQGKALNGNTMIPVTALRDAFGFSLSYNAGTRTYTAGNGSAKLNLEVSEYGVTTNLNGYFLYSNVRDEAKVLNGHLYVPFKLLSEYLGFQGVYNPSLKSLEISKRVMNDITISSESLTKSNTNAAIEIQYPTINGLTDEAQKAINTVLKQKADHFAAASEKQASKRDGSVERKYEFIQNYVVTFNREGVLSIVIDQYSYTGGAHGGTFREGLTFSLKNGKRLELGDLLKAAPNYKQTLDRLLKERTKKEDFAIDSAGLKDKPDFYVKEGGLAIFYQQYEIAPYAAGFPTYTFNFGELLPKGANPFASI